MIQILLGIACGGFTFLKWYQPCKRGDVMIHFNSCLIITIATLALSLNILPRFMQSFIWTSAALFLISCFFDTTNKQINSRFSKVISWIAITAVIVSWLDYAKIF